MFPDVQQYSMFTSRLMQVCIQLQLGFSLKNKCKEETESKGRRFSHHHISLDHMPTKHCTRALLAGSIKKRRIIAKLFVCDEGRLGCI